MTDVTRNQPADFTLYYAGGQLQASWDAASCPDGYSVVVEFLDATGNLLPQQPNVQYESGHATISPGTLAPGEAFYAWARLVSAPTATEHVVIHEVGPVGSVVVDWHQGRLHVTWTAPSGTGPFRYHVVLLDQEHHPVSPAPSIAPEGDTGAAIDGRDLVDGQTYMVSVQAEQDGSFGPTTDSAPYHLNKNLPDSPLLRALLARLGEAKKQGQGDFDLTPTLVQSDNITDLFGRLLQQANNTLAVSRADVTSDPDHVTLTAIVPYPFAAGDVESTFTFTADSQQLELSLAVNDLGTFTVQQLIEKNIIPGSMSDSTVWASGLTPFPQLDMELNSQEKALLFSGPPTASAWAIPIHLAQVQIGTVSPAMQIVAPDAADEPLEYKPCVRSLLTLGTSTQIPVLIQMPAGLEGWVFELQSADGVEIGDLANFNPLMNGANSNLPEGIVAIGGFRLTQLRFSFAADAEPAIWKVAAGFAVGPTADSKWTVLDGLIELKGITALLDITLFTGGGALNVSTVGSIGATLVIHDQLTISVGLSVPSSNGAWLLSGSAVLDDFNFSNLAAYLGGSASPITDALGKLGTIGSVSLNRFALLFTPTGSNAGLHALEADFSLASWQVPNLSWLELNQLYLSLEVQNPTSADRSLTGRIGGLLTVGDAHVAVDVDFSQADTWSLQLVGESGLLSGLEQLSSILPTQSILSSLPSELPTQTTYALGDFTLTYNTAESYVSSVTFLLDSNIGWSWLGNLLTLWNIRLDLQATKESASDSFAIMGSVDGTISIGEALFELSADKPTVEAPWSFAGDLAAEYAIDFNDALQDLHVNLQLPTGYGLPTAMEIQEASLRVIPSTGQLDFSGLAGFDWSYQFGQTTLAIQSIGGEFHLPGGEGAATGAVNGVFQIGNLQGFAEIALGDGKSSDTVIEVELATDAKAGSQAVVDEVIGAGTFDGVSVPSGFVKPSDLVQASLSLNLTKQKLLLTGLYAGSASNPLYAGAALLVANEVAEGEQAKWGFLLAASLDNWTLQSISPVLSGLDSIIGLNKASAAIAISLLAESSGGGEDLHAQVPAIPADLTIAPGLSFFAALDLNGGLLKNVKAILELQGTFTLSGHVPADTTQPITLTATMGSVKLLNTIAFQNVALQYVKQPTSAQGEGAGGASGPAGTGVAEAGALVGGAVAAGATEPADQQLTLTGDIVVSLDQPYTFHGDLLVTDEMGRFQVATTHSVVHPLGIPGITLDQLGFEFNATFANGSLTESQTMFYGQVTFAAGPTLLGLVGLNNGNAALVLVKLLTPAGQPAALSISNLFAQVTGLTWPDALDVSLSNGQLWYVPGEQAVTYQNQSYAAGFHASADVKIFFLPTMTLDLAVYSADTAMQKKGLVATAQLADPIDWKFVKFAGTAQHGGKSKGPWVEIDTRNTALPFGLGSSLELLGADIADVEIRVGKEKMAGTLTLPDSAGPFAGASLEFTWDEQGFHVENWPLQDLKLPKFDLEDLKGTGACSQVIIDLLPVDTKFNLDVSLSIAPPSGSKPAQLEIGLQGTFDLVVAASAYKSDPILSVDLVETTIGVPFPTTGGYDWNSLVDSFVDAIKDAGESIMENLLTGPNAAKNLAKLAGVVGVKWGIAEAVDYLVCRGMTTEAAELAVATAASAAGGTVAACDGAAVAVGGVLATIVGGVVVLAGSQPDPQKPKPGKPGRPQLTFDTNQLHLSWSGSSNANQYAISLLDANGHPVPVSSVSGTETSVSSDKLTLGQTYTARIIAYGEGGQSEPSDAGSLYLVAAPVSLALVFRDPVLTATWQPVAGHQAYEVRVLNGQGQPLQPAPNVQVQGETSTITGAALEQGGTIKVQVRATAQDDRGPWSESTLDIAVLPAPQGFTSRTVGAQLHVAWQAVPNASSYTGVVLDQNGQPLQPTPDIRIDGTTAVISGNGIVDGAHLQAKIKAQAVNAVGTYGTYAATVHVLSTPVGLQLLFDVPTRKLHSTWEAVSTATGYALYVLNQAGEPLNPQPSVAFTGADAVIEIATLPDATYGVKVMATAADAVSLWSEPVTVTLIELAAPTGLLLENVADTLVGTWNAVPVAQSYAAVVLDVQGNPLSPQPTIRIEGTTATVDASAFTVGTVYKVKVQALAPSIAGPFCEPVEMTRKQLDAPNMTALLYYSDTKRLNAAWDAVAGAESYELELLDANGQPLDPQPPVTYEGTNATVDASALVVGEIYRAQVRALAAQVKGFWSAAQFFTVLDLAAPSNLTLAYEESNLQAAWTAVDQATVYQAEVLDQNGQPLNPQPAITYANTTATISADELTAGATYQVQVRAFALHARAYGPFCAAVSLTIPVKTKTVLSMPGIGSGMQTMNLGAYSFGGTGDFTLTATIRGTRGGIVMYHHGSSAPRAGFDLSVTSQGLLSLTTTDANGNNVTYPNIGQTTVLDGQWHQIAAVRQTKNGACSYALYLDGKLLPAFPTSGGPLDITVNATFWIGAPADSPIGGSWIGDVKQVCLWNTALDSAEIANLNSSLPNPDDWRLAGYWPLTDNSTEDLSHNRNGGSLQGGAQLVSQNDHE